MRIFRFCLLHLHLIIPQIYSKFLEFSQAAVITFSWCKCSLLNDLIGFGWLGGIIIKSMVDVTRLGHRQWRHFFWILNTHFSLRACVHSLCKFIKLCFSFSKGNTASNINAMLRFLQFLKFLCWFSFQKKKFLSWLKQVYLS